MDENRRKSERHEVSLYIEQIERESAPPKILNLSSSGFLVRGDLCAGVGGIFHASFRVRPVSGEMRVSTKGTVVHSRVSGSGFEYGIKIEGFSSPAEESAYMDYVRELSQGKSL